MPRNIPNTSILLITSIFSISSFKFRKDFLKFEFAAKSYFPLTHMAMFEYLFQMIIELYKFLLNLLTEMKENQLYKTHDYRYKYSISFFLSVKKRIEN
jgi:hypothetical protein